MFSYDYKNKKLVENGFSRIEKHKVSEYYEIITRHDSIDSISLSSRKSAKISLDHSLLFYDNKEREIVVKKIEEVLDEQSRYFLIFRGVPRVYNDTVEIAPLHDQREFFEIKLNHITGFLLTAYLKQKAGILNIVNSSMYDMIMDKSEEWATWMDIDFVFYKKTYNSSLFKMELKLDPESPHNLFFNNAIISNEYSSSTIPNELIFSSNWDFVLGMLEGFIATEKTMTHNISEILVHKKIPLNLYTNIFSYLFTKYTVTHAKHLGYPDEYTYSLKFKLSKPKFERIQFCFDKIKKQTWTWVMEPDGEVKIDKWDYLRNPEEADKEIYKQLTELKNRDEIKFVRVDEVVLTYVEKETELYDIVTDNPNATNYFMPLCPAAKNSDGDVLAVMGVFTKEGNKAAEKLMLNNIDRIKDPQNPDEYRNWVQKDAILGLYTLTK